MGDPSVVSAGPGQGHSAVLTDSHSSSGFQHRKQAGLDQAHQRSDPGEDHPPERRPEGAHSPPENGPRRQAEGEEVSARDVRCLVGQRRVSLPLPITPVSHIV